MSTYQIIYIISMITLVSFGFYLLKSTWQSRSGKRKKIRFRTNPYIKMNNDVKNILSDTVLDHVFMESGIFFSAVTYNLFRYIILLTSLSIGIVSYVYYGKDPMNQFLLTFGIFIGTYPRLKINRFKTPFGWMLERIAEEYKEKKDLEIYRSITQLKNLAVAQQHKPLGADFIIEQLMKFTKVLKPIYAQTLALWRLGKEVEACNYFADATGTKLGYEFANILNKLDTINPVELVDQLILYQTHVKEERVTQLLKKQETKSNLMFVPILMLAFAIMMNFMMIVVWLDSFGALSTM